MKQLFPLNCGRTRGTGFFSLIGERAEKRFPLQKERIKRLSLKNLCIEHPQVICRGNGVKPADSKKIIMEDLRLWSSNDLMNWKLESVLKSEQTYIGKPFDGCWATNIVKHNGKYCWHFSERNEQLGVMVSDSPSGPWKDPPEKPLLPAEEPVENKQDPLN